MYYLAFFSCSLLRVSRQSIYRLREIPLAIFYVITNALVSHTFRYAIYVLIVNPWGKALPWENVCYPEGSKSISGHTHMYAFHGVFLWYTYTCTNDQLSQDPSATKQSRSFLDVIVQWFKISVFLSSSCLSMFSIWKTYAGGYHSVRDMVLGGLFGIFSVVLYVVSRAGPRRCGTSADCSTRRGDPAWPGRAEGEGGIGTLDWTHKHREAHKHSETATQRHRNT